MRVDAGGSARELGAKEVGVRRQSADPGDELTHRLAGLCLVDARVVELAFQPHQPRPPGDGNGDVVLGENGDDITRRQRDVVGRVALEDRLAY